MNGGYAIDLGAERSHLCNSDGKRKILVKRKVAHDIAVVHSLSQPPASTPHIVESTFN